MQRVVSLFLPHWSTDRLRRKNASSSPERHDTIACDAPLGYDGPVAARAEADPEMLDALAATLRFGPMTRRRLRGAAGLDADTTGDAQPSPLPA